MTWNDYNVALTPLIQRFGAPHYPKDVIQKGFFYWKSKTKEDLIEEINRSISFNVPLEINPAQDKSKRPERHKWTPEEYHQTEGFLDNLLKANKVGSVLELVQKEREKIRNCV